MKSIDKYLVYVLLLAVLGLYIMQFSNTGGTVEDSELIDTTTTVKTNSPKQGLIYYVNTDTIWDQYDYVQDALAELGSRKKQYESRLEKQYRSFEAEVAEFQQRGSLMSEVELQIKQRDLMRKEGELNKLKEELEIKILTEEKEWNDKLRAKIVGYIDAYTQDRNYDYILGYSITSNIILANDSLNLTSPVLNGLNEDYRAQKEVE